VSVLASFCVSPIHRVNLYFILYFGLYCIHSHCIPVYVCGQVPRTTCIRSVLNVFISVVYFLYIYTACDVFYYYFISCVADPSWLFSLRAFYSASGPFSLRALPLHGTLLIIIFIYALVWYSAFGPISPFGSLTSLKEGARSDYQVIQLCLVGEPRDQRFIANSVRV